MIDRDWTIRRWLPDSFSLSAAKNAQDAGLGHVLDDGEGIARWFPKGDPDFIPQVQPRQQGKILAEALLLRAAIHRAKGPILICKGSRRLKVTVEEVEPGPELEGFRGLTLGEAST